MNEELYLLLLFLIVTFGPVIGLFLTGLLADRFVLRRILKNKRVERLMVAVDTIADHADKLDKLLSYAEKMVENQKKNG
jgi:hypothetical protein